MISKIYHVEGMTCQGCKASVENSIRQLNEVQEATVDLASGTVEVTSDSSLELDTIKSALKSKYTISEQNIFKQASIDAKPAAHQSKWLQLKPLFLILGYILVASILLNYNRANFSGFMPDFMGLFFVVFSFFKILDLKGFPESFRMYDPLAKVVPFYGWIYPFIELALGLMFLMRIELLAALVVTVVVLGITTIGVTQSLLGKRKIKCACLGTALNLPMTEATFIENAIMIAMAIYLLIKTGWL